ncbi:MAG: hypothetical protein HYZ48_01635 [Chlamydiales bacterium]|nr:hypothetical protein [Chlamydiales bacterium]
MGWTHLNTDSHKSFSVAPGDVGAFPLIPSIAPFLLGSVATKAAGDWHLRYNILDAELGRQFFVGKWLALKPIIGLRGGWISQRFQTEYSSIFVTQSSGTFFLDTSFNSKQNLGGVGLRIGSDAKFYMGNAWSLLGNLSTSILWTSIDLKQTFDGYNPPPVGTPIANTVTSKDHFDKLRTNLEGQLGLQWETFYHQDRFRFAISTLYTFSYWFGVNQLTNQIIATSDSAQPTAISQISNGDLQLQGLNIKFDFDF